MAEDRNSKSKKKTSVKTMMRRVAQTLYIESPLTESEQEKGCQRQRDVGREREREQLFRLSLTIPKWRGGDRKRGRYAGTVFCQHGLIP